MKRRTRIYYAPEQKAIIWNRYKQGDSLHDIDRMFDRNHSSVMPLFPLCYASQNQCDTSFQTWKNPVAVKDGAQYAFYDIFI